VKQIFYFLLIFLVLVLPKRVAAQIGFPYCETFQLASTQANTFYGGDAQLVLGAGVLRLTSNAQNQRGYIYINVPFPSTYGLKAEFEYFSYGSNNQGDGFSAFLFDGDAPTFSAGGFGGALGYGPRDNEPGLANAYLGIGFDEFGNFGTTHGNMPGRFNTLDQNGRAPNAIVVRGPGNGFTGYQFVVGRKTMEEGTDKDGLNPGAQFPISSGVLGSNRVTDPNMPGYRKVFLELQPNVGSPGFFLTLTMQVTTEPDQPRMVTIFDRQPYFFPAPKNLKIGFASSTGGSTNFHEIRSLIVQVAADDALKDPVGVDFTNKALSCAGKENQYYITDEEIILPNENSSIRCLQFYESLDDILEESSDLCSQARCVEANRVKILPQGTFEANDQAGGFTFFPNEAFIDQEVTVYYTITDNYGKTSKGNSITLQIKESPDPITLKVSGATQPQDVLIICEGESIKLVGEGDEVYDRFTWTKDGVLLEGATSQELEVNLPGLYEVNGFNRNGCSSASNKLEVKWVDYPELKLTKPIVECLIGQSVDVGSFIAGFDAQLYDYRLVGEGLDLENEELKEVSTSGMFELQVKPKGFTCYSDPFPVEIYIQEIPLEVNFDFGVVGTGIKDDAGGGVFPDDVIQFTDLSEDRAVKWEWDFGDETSSIEKDPIHIFGKKGEFEVILVLTDKYGCQNSFSQKVSITKSYRLMVPNSFTPTKEENKTFVPKFKGIAQLELSVFNQWGELIYRSDELKNAGWDGTVSGVLQEAGFYFYSLVGNAADGEKVESTGKFRLIR
jgi:hypothetical protein